MHTFINKIIRHRIHFFAILLAISLGIATGLPQIIGQQKNPAYKGIHTILTDDEGYHLVRTQEAIDGHTFIANPYFKEYKNSPTPIAWLPEFLPALFGRLFNISAITVYTIADFILPMILALLTYTILLKLTEQPRWALLGTGVLHAGIFFETMGHPISPQLNIIFLLIFFYYLIDGIKTNRLRSAIGGGIALAFMINTYFYYWTYAVVFCAFLLCAEFILRDYKKIKRIILLLCIGMIGGIPNFYGLTQSTNSPFYEETFRRFGALNTHFPSGVTIIAVSGLVLVLTIIALRKKIIENQHVAALLISGSAAALIASNQHIITGINILFSSHYRFQMFFWSVFVIIYLCSRYEEKINRRLASIIFISASSFIGIVCVVYISQTIITQMRATQNNVGEQRLADAFTWFNTHATPESVVLANEMISEHIPLYTKNNVAMATLATMSLVPTQELVERVMLTEYDESITESFAEKNQFKIWGAYHLARFAHTNTRNKIRNLFSQEKTDNPRVTTDDVLQLIVAGGKIKKYPYTQLLQKYQVEYLLIDEARDTPQLQERAKQFPRVYNAEQISIFAVPAVQPSHTQ